MTARHISWCIPLENERRAAPAVREMVLFGVLGALTFALQVAMSFLPNIEPVSLLVMLFAVVFGWKALYPVYLFVAMEILFYGVNLWNAYYLYVWLILAVAAILLKRMESPLNWAILSGTFGLLFGALCAIIDAVIGGFGYAAAKWVFGIPFDVTHCIGNFVIALLLFKPLRGLLTELYGKMCR